MIDKLKKIIEINCVSTNADTTTLSYWSEVVFAKSIFFAAPLSLMALVPAFIICMKTESYLILWFDVFCFITLVLAGYLPNIKLVIRKIYLIFLLYLASFILLMELGYFGPGLVYLLSTTVFTLLLFPNIKSKIPFFITFKFCVVYGLLIYFNLVIVYPSSERGVLEWMAISSNVLFLSILMCLIIPLFLRKLESTLEEKIDLLESVRRSNHELSKTVSALNVKNEELEQFTFVASHDLQEPLQQISSFMKKLKAKYGGQLDEKGLQYIEFATEGSNRMKQLLLDLLAYFKAGNDDNGLELVDINLIIEEYRVLREKIFSDKQVKINMNNLPILNSLREPLVQTLYILIDNAIKFSKENLHPIIDISAEELPDSWSIRIQDNGIGIDPKFFEQIFVIFQRLHNKDKYSGNGLGLSIAKRHVESWGGKIWVDSEPSIGSVFYFNHPKEIS